MAKEKLSTLQIKKLEEQVLMINIMKNEIIDGRGKFWYYDISYLIDDLNRVLKRMKNMLDAE